MIRASDGAFLQVSNPPHPPPRVSSHSVVPILGDERMYNIPLLALVCGFLFSIYRFIVYPTFLSPLARIPNSHFTASFSPLWILWKRYRGAENKAIHDAHVKYGPIVRVGPNDIDVNCVEGGIKTIASFEKPNWYPNAFMNFGYTIWQTCCSR